MTGERLVTMAEIAHRFIHAYNAFDVPAMLVLLSQDVRFENYSGGVLTASTNGKEAFRQLAEQSVAMFSMREQRVRSLQGNGDVILLDIAYRGTLAVDIQDGPVAGTLIELSGSSEFSFDGRLVRSIVDRS